MDADEGFLGRDPQSYLPHNQKTLSDDVALLTNKEDQGSRGKKNGELNFGFRLNGSDEEEQVHVPQGYADEDKQGF